MIDPNVIKLVREAVEEDLGPGDMTTEGIFSSAVPASARILAKEELVLAGLEVAREVFAFVDNHLVFSSHHEDGDRIKKGETIAEINGDAASTLKAERTALNFLQHLSGVATLTSLYVRKVADLPVKIMDTRKTLPGFRQLEKYAVRMGGGTNHRVGLYDAVLIKDNHIIAAGGIGPAVRKVRERFPEAGPIEVETSDLEEVRQALEVQADIIMLDNMDLTTMRDAVTLINKRAEVEASGNISFDTLREVALTGVDRISVGALTHSVRAVDISLRMEIK